jgi:hypothetical protein
LNRTILFDSSAPSVCILNSVRAETTDIDVLKEGYLELKEDNKRLQEQIAALIEASKRAAENKRILDDTEPPLALHNALQTCKSLSAYSSSRFSSFFCLSS